MKFSIIGSLAVLSASTVAAAHDRVVVFADSLTDNGNDYKNSNYPSSPPYYKGRFSNGPTWLEYVAKNISIPVENHGYGGATANNDDSYSEYNGWVVPGLKQQVATLKSNGTAQSLYIIQIGYNDISSIVNPELYVVVNKNYTYEKIVANVVSSVKDIVNKYQAQDFAFFNVPPIDKWPVTIPEKAAKTSKLVRSFNQLVETEVKKIPNIKSTFYDLNSWFLAKMADPTALGLSIAVGPCVPLNPNNTNCDNPNDHFFFDTFHPESKVHKAWGEWATGQLVKDFQIN